MQKLTFELLDESNQTAVHFLQIGLTSAFTLLDIATSMSEEEAALRNLRNAHHIYCTVLRLVTQVSLSSEEQIEFQKRIVDLGDRLETSDYFLTNKNVAIPKDASNAE